MLAVLAMAWASLIYQVKLNKMRQWRGPLKLRPLVDGFVYHSKATQAEPKVGSLSIFMKLALCEIGFCLMHPCMADPLQKTPELPRLRGETRTLMVEANEKDDTVFEKLCFVFNV